MAHADVHHDPLDAPTERIDRARTAPDTMDGIIAGIAGGCVIALFFFVIDVAAGHALWTPTTLGAAFFQGKALAPGAPASGSLVAGYTVLHTVGFVALGLIATQVLQALRRLPSPAVLVPILAAPLFFAFQAYILVLGAFTDPALLQRIGTGRVAIANALAALAMGGVLAWRATGTRGQRSAVKEPTE